LILGIFQLIPYFLDLTVFGRKHIFSIFDFAGATGLRKGQGHGAQLGNFETNFLR
jgi:hypothetical protein